MVKVNSSKDMDLSVEKEMAREQTGSTAFSLF